MTKAQVFRHEKSAEGMMFKVYHTTPTLWKTAKRQNRVYWVGEAVTDGTDFYRRSRTWQDVAGGGQSVELASDPARVEPKNVGRANATTARQQAILEIDALATLKKQQGYAELGQMAPQTYPLPMLAHKYTDYGHKLQWPVLAQPKLDGMRALYRDGVFWSRKGLPLLAGVTTHIQIIASTPTRVAEDSVVALDGELILNPNALQPGQDLFQETMKAVKRVCTNSQYLQYWVFDVLTSSPVPFSERWAVLQQVKRDAKWTGAQLVPTISVTDLDEAMAFHQSCVELGFEGIMLRDPTGRYEIGHRSQHLLKYKEFVDDEFPIVAVHQGTGADAGAAIFECALPTDVAARLRAQGLKDTFRVRPRGTIESRRAMFAHSDDYVGKWLTVIYQNLSDVGVPRFPVGKGIRDE